jgi:DNA-binding HxlR family transcriptional regulator
MSGRAAEGGGVNQISRDTVTGPPTTSLRRALRVLGDPWTMLILKEAYNGERRFGGFQKKLNIPKQTLSLRLTHLCHEQMMYRRQVSPTHTTLEYALTAKAFDLQDAMYSIWLWHEANPRDVSVLPFEIIHRTCGQPLSARYRCMHCRNEVLSESVTVEHTQPLQFDPRDRLARRNDAAVTAAGDLGTEKMVAASLVGDIACNEILYTLFRSPSHLKAIADDLDLGISVARGRLEKLCLLGLVEERKDGRKLTYSVLPKAEKFYPLLLSIADWGDRWCNDGQPPPELRVHSCGQLLHGRFCCDHCGGWIGRENVYVRPRQDNSGGEGN